MAKKKEYSCVLVETDDEGITWITFNRPEKRNAMNPTLYIEMEQILFEHETDEATKVIVITGAGNSWSAGMDLKHYFPHTDKDPPGCPPTTRRSLFPTRSRCRGPPARKRRRRNSSR